MMILVVAVAICIVAWKPIYYLIDYHFAICAMAGFVTAWIVGQRMRDEGPSECNDERSRLPRSLFVCAPVLLILGFTMWIRHRWIAMPDDALIAFPSDFPDGLLIAIHDWFDKRNPGPDGFVKIHGERPIVQFIVDVFAQSIFAIFGLALGVTTKRSGMIGIDTWRRRLAKTRRLLAEMWRMAI